MDNQSYYDTFAESYEAKRHEGYHRFLDEAEFSLISPYATDAEVLEVGCGTGLILARAAKVARRAAGMDISPGMLELARSRGLEVQEGTATSLPFDDDSFDLTYSFKVLAHVEGIEVALEEMARVTRPGGKIFAEFYNTQSLRTLVKHLKPGTRIGRSPTTDDDVYTRYDSLADVKRWCPRGVRVEGFHGIRIASPLALPFDLPLFGKLWSGLERGLMKTPLRRFGGFLVVEFTKL